MVKFFTLLKLVKENLYSIGKHNTKSPYHTGINYFQLSRLHTGVNVPYDKLC